MQQHKSFTDRTELGPARHCQPETNLQHKLSGIQDVQTDVQNSALTAAAFCYSRPSIPSCIWQKI